ANQITRTWTATDAANRTASSVQVITLQDTTDPTPVCQSIIINLNGSNSIDITASDIDGGSFDNCGTVTLSVSQTTFTIADLGNDVIVTLTVMDESGNTATCNTTVTVEDTTLSTDDKELDLFNISPNPFKDAITIKLPRKYSGDEFNITIYDLNGRKVYNKVSIGNNGSINLNGLNNLEQALYLIRILNINNGDIFNKRLIKF
ncbi:T9SS type A sorting domain-containing protein, partial [Winogradskyella immobilis]